MRKNGKKPGGLAVALIAAVVGAQTPVLAQDAGEELEQILEAQLASEQESALESYLGLDALTEAMAENGVSVQAQLGLTEGTALQLEGAVPEDAYLTIAYQQDPQEKQWLFSAGAGIEDSDLLNLSLYGDEEMLVLELPQFYDGTIGLRSGDLLEQYEGSALEAMIGEDLDELGIEEFILDFYPDGSQAESMNAELSEDLEEEIEEFLESVTIEKEDTGETSVYTATVVTEDFLELYESIWDEYLDILDETGLLSYYVYELEDYTDTSEPDSREQLETLIEDMTEEISGVLGDVCTVSFYVEENLVQRITFSVDVYEEDEADETESNGEDSNVSDALMGLLNGSSGSARHEGEEPVGAIEVSVEFEDPAQPEQVFTVELQATDYESDYTGVMRLVKQSAQEDSVSSTIVTLEVEEYEEDPYEITVYQSQFDSESGELLWVLGAFDTEAGDLEGIGFYGAFHDVVPGSSFGLTVYELSVIEDSDSVGITAEITVQADAGTIETPQDSDMLLELDEDSLNLLIMNLYYNAVSWAEEAENTWNTALGIETETESETEWQMEDGSREDSDTGEGMDIENTTGTGEDADAGDDIWDWEETEAETEITSI